MFNCDKCKNKVICKNIEQASEVMKEIKEIQIKYKDFFGRIDVHCDYFINEISERNIQDSAPFEGWSYKY